MTVGPCTGDQEFETGRSGGGSKGERTAVEQHRHTDFKRILQESEWVERKTNPAGVA